MELMLDSASKSEYGLLLRDHIIAEFACDNGMCVPGDVICDGTNNCWDNTDEYTPCGKENKEQS